MTSGPTPAAPDPRPARLGRLRAALDAAQLDALLVSLPESRYYLSGYTGHDLPPRDSAGYLLVTPDRALLLTDPRTTLQAEREAPLYQVVTYPSGSQGPETVASVARDLRLARIGFEPVHLPYAIFATLQAHLDGATALVPADGLVDDLRRVKDAQELATLQAAIDAVDQCFEFVVARLEPGVRERDLARTIEVYLLEHAEGVSFPPIVASGPNAAIPHADPTDRRLEAGEPLTLDLGARVGGYCSDMTRTVCLGPPRDPRLAEVYDRVLEAQARVEREVRPGMTGRQADALARDFLAAAGYGEAFTHGLGHGVGLEVHEPPSLSAARGAQPLEPGMVFSVEPGVYLPRWGGVRLEDLVVLEPGGARVLTGAPKRLVL